MDNPNGVVLEMKRTAKNGETATVVALVDDALFGAANSVDVLGREVMAMKATLDTMVAEKDKK